MSGRRPAQSPEGQLVEQAYRLHQGQVFRYLLRRTRSPSEAEELTQIVFTHAAAALPRGAPPESLIGWLYAVAERRFIDEVRRRERGRKLELQLGTRLRAGELEYGPSAARAIADAIAALPVEQQQVVTMKVLEGRPFAEIGSRLGITEGAAKMRYMRALRSVREELERTGHTP